MTHVSNNATAAAATPTREAVRPWLGAALAVAALTVAGSLYLSLGMHLNACPLCFYQRAFALSLVAVLGLGLLTGVGQSARLGLMALPLALAGCGVAAFHVYLELSGTLECPAGLLQLGTAPQQSLAMFVVLVVLLAADVLTRPGVSLLERGALGGGIVVGLLLALASTVANPPPPASPTQPYDKAPVVCRPPYVPR